MNGMIRRYEESSFEREVRANASRGSVNTKEKRAHQPVNNNHLLVTTLSVLLSADDSAAAKVSSPAFCKTPLFCSWKAISNPP